MISAIYLEDGLDKHPVARSVLARYPKAVRIPIPHYGEVFNRKAQNFRLQKRQPALILARKGGQATLPIPPHHGMGQRHNYYFSHFLNCPYDCRYCFLQGKYPSAHYVLFVNYEVFEAAIDDRLSAHCGEEVGFFSGYDGDSLAMEPLTGFAEHFLAFFQTRGQGWLELRTKSTQIRTLLRRPPLANAVVAFSLTPSPLAAALEHGAATLEQRVAALVALARAGWSVGLRFDPLIYHPRFEALYVELFAAVFDPLSQALGKGLPGLHSVSLGPLRWPKAYFQTLLRLYPDEPLLAGEFAERGGVVSYPLEVEAALGDFCRHQLLARVGAERLFAWEG
ncbi:MAG: spore photoproduct lyase family protein [Candidatus Competibacterales bacterium]